MSAAVVDDAGAHGASALVMRGDDLSVVLAALQFAARRHKHQRQAAEE